jgi:hypothetical protein
MERNGTLTAVDRCNRHQNPRSPCQRSAQIRRHTQQTQDRSSESGGGRDDALELLVHRSFAVAGHDELLVLELLGNLSGTGAGDFDPGFRKEGTLGGVCEKELVRGEERGKGKGEGKERGAEEMEGEREAGEGRRGGWAESCRNGSKQTSQRRRAKNVLSR